MIILSKNTLNTNTILDYTSNMGLAGGTAVNIESGHHSGIYRASPTPPIESLLGTSYPTYEEQTLDNLSGIAPNTGHFKSRRCNKTQSNVDTSESHNDSPYKRRKLSMSPSICQYRVQR